MKRLIVLAAAATVMTGAFAGIRHHADGAVQAAVTRFERTLPAGRGFTYASVSADLFGGDATLEDVRFTLENGMTLSAASVTVAGVGEDDGVQAIGRLVATGVALAGADPTSNLRLRVGRLEARRLRAVPLAGMLDGGALGWPEFSGLDLGDIALTDAGKTLLSVTSGEIKGGGFGHIGRSTFSDIRLPIERDTAEPRRLDLVTIAAVELSGLNYAPMLRLPPSPSAEQVRAAIAETGDSTLLVSDIVGARDGAELLAVDAITGATDNDDDGTSRQRLRFGGIVLAGDLFVNDAGVNVLEELGYGELRGELLLEAAYDAPAGRLELAPVKLELTDAASLEVGLAVGEVPLRFLSPGYEPTADELTKFTFEGLSVELRDDSLLQRIATMIGGRQGIDGDVYRQAQAASLRQTAAEAEAPAARDFLTEIADFVEQPGALAIDASPRQPIPLVALVATAMSDPQVALSLLDIEIASR